MVRLPRGVIYQNYTCCSRSLLSCNFLHNCAGCSWVPSDQSEREILIVPKYLTPVRYVLVLLLKHRLNIFPPSGVCQTLVKALMSPIFLPKKKRIFYDNNKYIQKKLSKASLFVTSNIFLPFYYWSIYIVVFEDISGLPYNTWNAKLLLLKLSCDSTLHVKIHSEFSISCNFFNSPFLWWHCIILLR